MHILNKYFHHFIFNLYTTKKKKNPQGNRKQTIKKKKRLDEKSPLVLAPIQCLCLPSPLGIIALTLRRKARSQGSMCRAGLAGDVHSRELMFPLWFFFQNKKLGFCQHRFLQKTSNFPENKKNWQCFSSESTPGRESWKWKRQPQSECYNKTSLKWLHSNL